MSIMEDVLSNLSDFRLTEYVNSPYAEHPRFAQYKIKKPGYLSHEERCRKVLEARNDARYDLLAHVRKLEECSDGESEFSEDNMECEQAKQIYRRPKQFRNFLMLSEWLVDIPDDFASSYIAVPCPEGRRVVVSSAKGNTRAYFRNGNLMSQFPSLLPGGSHQTAGKGIAVLDCVWNESLKTFYCLDLMVWLNQSIVDAETSFRFHWLHSRLTEASPDVAFVSQINPFRFLLLPFCDCSPESLSAMMNVVPFQAPTDGILFYHKEGHYTHGPTPLVGWLKVFMLPEILGIGTPQSINHPLEYADAGSFIQKYENDKQIMIQKMKQKKKKKQKHDDKKMVLDDGLEHPVNMIGPTVELSSAGSKSDSMVVVDFHQ